MRQTALLITSAVVRRNLDQPNSELSKKIAAAVEDYTGISQLEVHRFHNAIVNKNVHNSFREDRAHELAGSFLKADILFQKKLAFGPGRKRLEKMAKDEQIPLSYVLATYRALFIEIINEELADEPKKSR